MTEQEWLASDDPQAMLGYLQSPSDNANPNHIYPPSDRKLRLFACACARQVWHLLTDERSRKAVEVAERLTDHGRMTSESEERQAASVHAMWAQADAKTNEAAYAADAAWAIVGHKDAGEAVWQVLGRLCPYTAMPISYAAQAALLRDIVGDPFRPVRPLREACAACSGKGGRSAMGWQPQISSTAYGSSWLICRECHGQKERVAGWITPQALSLAQATYDERQDDATLDSARLAVLSDALEEAGCPTEEECGQCPKLEKAKVGSFGYYDRDMASTIIEWGKRKKACRCGGTGKVPQPLLTHLRSPGPHVRGCWALDLILGKEVMCNV